MRAAISYNVGIIFYVDASFSLGSELQVSEGDADIQICVSITNLPPGGVDSLCQIEVTLNFTGISAGKFRVQWHIAIN